MRRIVVLPEPEGPSRATSSPLSDIERHAVNGAERVECLHDLVEADLHGGFSRDGRGEAQGGWARPGALALAETLGDDGDEGQNGEDRGGGEGAGRPPK